MYDDPLRYNACGCEDDEDYSTIMVYPQYDRGKDRTVNAMLCMHSKLIQSPVAQATRTKSDALWIIRSTARLSEFVHVAMCGRVKEGAVIMTDDAPLSVSDVVDALVKSDFRGRALISLNACHSDADDVQPVAPNWGAITQFEWTFIESCEGAQKRSNADHFARMMSVVEPIIRERREAPEDMARVVKHAWNMTRCSEDKPENWVPAPHVASIHKLRLGDERDDEPPADISATPVTLEDLRTIFEVAFSAKTMEAIAVALSKRRPTQLEARVRGLVEACKASM